MHIVSSLLIVTLLMMSQLSAADVPPKRAILVIIDGLHIDAPVRLAMPNYSRLAKRSASVAKTCVIMPHHPTHGRYADIHTCSYPNPVMMTGTVFLVPNQKMLQHSFQRSAFISNTNAYRSIGQDYQFAIQEDAPDSFSIDNAIAVLANHEVDFVRIHLQDSGTAGYETFNATEDAPYFRNIWHQGSPYARAVEEADRQLGRLISALEERGELAHTLLVITGDHGQSTSGWHPMLDEAGWLTPMLFHGPGIIQGVVVEWADQIDIAPTIAAIMGTVIPNNDGGSGRVLKEIQQHRDVAPNRSRLLTLNRILTRYAYAAAAMVMRSKDTPAFSGQLMLIEREFYGLDRILDWNEKGSIDSLIKHNTRLVNQMEVLLSASAK